MVDRPLLEKLQLLEAGQQLLMEQINILTQALKSLQFKKTDETASAVNETAHTEERWLDSQEAAEMLHTSKRGLQRLRDTGKIPYTGVRGSKCHYKLSDINAYLEKAYKKPAIPELDGNPYL